MAAVAAASEREADGGPDLPAVKVPALDSLPVRARSLCTKTCRPVYWIDDGDAAISSAKLYLIDQRQLPAELILNELRSKEDVFYGIRRMVVRGAPAIGVAGAYGLVLALLEKRYDSADAEALVESAEAAKKYLDEARPTAVNLEWATLRMVDSLKAFTEAKPDATASEIRRIMLAEAHAICDDDVRVNKRLAEYGAALITKGSNLLHHCNTGALATIDYGTALGVIYECHNTGKDIHVWVDETRPRLQGSRLTAWELMRAGVPMHLVADSAAGLLMQRGKVDAVVFGADRVARNGDVANKVGTFKVCVVAREFGVQAYACVPTSTIDLSIASGDEIPIEERGAAEVATVFGTPTAPEGVPVFNPAFDMTPARFLTGIITEEGVCYPPYEMSLTKAVEAAAQRAADDRKKRMESLAKEALAGSAAGGGSS